MDKFIYIQGKVGVSRVHQPDVDTASWYVKLYFTPSSYETFMKLKEPQGEKTEGILNEVKNDEDGDFAWFRRRTVMRWKGVDTALPPPVVIDKDGNPQHEWIGAGSDVTLKLEKYHYNKPMRKGRGTAIRLVGVKVDNLVPFQKSDMSEQQKQAAEGLEQQPAQTW